MDDSFGRREACRPRRVSATAELGANARLQNDDVIMVTHGRKPQPAARRLSSAAGRMERRNSAPQVVHQRHMPIQPNKFHIPKKNKENKALFQLVSTESREYENMKTILTSSYIDTNSAGCFVYSNPRLVHSEPLEKEFVEKRKEMKADGRTEKELEESYCFLLTSLISLPILCEKGLTVGQSRITVLGDPGKGVYLSRYSDLLQMNSLTPGTTGEIIIVKVMKGKVKSFYENMKTIQDPTPNFDSHIAKNASKVTSLNCYRAFELTQQYFYEYLLAELQHRPRQVCPFAVVSFQFKGKDASLPSKPTAPIRSTSQLSERSKEFGPFTVWTGDLVKNKRVLFQISLQSSSTPFLPHRLPEKLDVGYLMRFDRVTKLIPSGLFSYNLYNSSKEVVTEGHYCSLLEVTDRNQSTVNVTRLLQELEIKRVVLVSPLTERGFLFLLSSVQMATPSERGETWKRCLQALFVFPEPRDVSGFASRCSSSSHESLMSDVSVMSRLKEFIPALHHALIKARANPPPNLSAGVELQIREYLSTLSDGSVQQYPMNEYESKLDEEGNEFPPPPKHHRVNMDSYVKSYLSNPTPYLLPVARARQVLKEHRGLKQPQETVHSGGGQREETDNRDRQSGDQKMQQLLDLISACKRNAEMEVRREGGEALKAPKRKLDQETAERALKYFKASQETGRHEKIPVGGNRVPSSPFSSASMIDLLGLKDVDLREHGSELKTKFMRQLKGLIKTANQSMCEPQEEGPKDSSPFGLLATKLGLPANRDIDLRKQEELEEQTGGSVSSLEGFSPGSHSGEANHHGGAGRGGGGLGRRTRANEEEKDEWEIPWVLIPITGLSTERYSQRDRNIPQDPRFQHITMATSITTTKPAKKCPTLSPEHSSSSSTIKFPSPDPSPPASPSQCPSPDPSPPASPSQCPSPDPSLPASPSQCPSPDPSPPPSPSEYPSPVPSPPSSPAQSESPETSSPQTSSQRRSLEPNELNPLKKNHSGANEPQSAPTVLKEFPEESGEKEIKHQGNKIIKEETSGPADMDSFNIPAPEFKFKPSPPPSEQVKEIKGETRRVEEVKAKTLKVQPCKVEQKLSDAEAVMFRHIKSEEEEVIIEVTNEQKKREVQEPESGSTLSPPVSSYTACPDRDIDSIVDKHVGDFTSDLQLLLQEESDNRSFPQLSHSLNTFPSTSEHTSLSTFSHYVSLFNPCPPVQDYVSSLKDSISCMLAEFDESWPRHRADSSRTDVDATLAKRISEFVSSFRAASAETGSNNEDFPLCGEQTAADVEPSVSRGPALSTAEETWQPEDTNWRSPSSPQPSSSDPTSAFGSTYKPENLLEISRTITQNIREAQDSHKIRTVEEEAGGNCIVTVPGYSSVSDPPAEASHSEPASSPSPAVVLDSDSKPVPSTTHLSSVINQLNPDVLNSLVEIAKDIKRKSQQFYIHCTEPGDPVYEEVKEHLLKLGNVQQSPVDFLQQENSENGLLVIIKNRDIAGHIHKIPGLMALKRHSSVVFVGIDSLDDIKNNSCIELFVSGGCIISDEFLFNPDVITHHQLTALLLLLEEHSSPESVWRWKIHCKTHKKLKEQARFRKDAANLLDVLSTYQKRQIIEFLPYHHCDMSAHHSPDLSCLIELQARYTQFRHTIYLTEHHFEKFPAYISEGIIMASVEEILQNFNKLVGCHNIRDKQLLVEDHLAPKGHSRQLSHQDSATGCELSPSTSLEHTPPILSSAQLQEVLPQPSSTLPFLPHLSDQIVPDTLCKDNLSPTTSRDMKFLQQAIRQLRAQRLEQQKLLKQQQLLLEMQVEASSSLIPNPAGSEPPPLVHKEPTEPVQLMPSRNAAAAIQEPIHSVLQPELRQKPRREDRRQQPPTEGGGRRGSPEGDELEGQRDGTPVRAVGLQTENWTSSKSDSSAYLSGQTETAVPELSYQTEPSSDENVEETGQQGEAEAEHDASTAEGSSSRDTQLHQEQPVKTEINPQSSRTVGVIPVVTPRDFKPAPIQQHTQQHPQPLSLPVLPPQRGVPLLQRPPMVPFHSQPFHPGSLLRPLGALGGIGSLMGPTHPWPGGLAPTGAPLVWGLQPTGVNFLERYFGSTGPGSDMYRGTQPGGGFNRM